jgi:hypothetical protein
MTYPRRRVGMLLSLVWVVSCNGPPTETGGLFGCVPGDRTSDGQLAVGSSDGSDAGGGGGHTASATTLTAGGAVHLTDYTDNDGPTSTVILAGAIGDFGKAQSVNPDGSASTKHNSELNLMLTHGSFRLDFAELDKRFIGVLGNLAVNTTTCSATASVSGAVPIVAGSGTGSYKGVTGTFNLTVTLDEVYKPGACHETGAYLAQSIVTTGLGTVSFR